jgi:antirestriction protein
MTTRTIDKYDDTIDSRDVIERIEELRADDSRTDDETAELRALEALQGEAEGYCPDWSYGATLIRDSYFVTYAQELADDLGLIPRDAGWPCTCIDWDQAARELRMDYTAVEFDGITYWVR